MDFNAGYPEWTTKFTTQEKLQYKINKLKEENEKLRNELEQSKPDSFRSLCEEFARLWD